MKKSRNKKITSKEFDERFDRGEDMAGLLDKSKATVSKKTQRINIDFPVYFLKKLDKEAKEIGVARTALIKMWLAQHLEQMRH